MKPKVTRRLIAGRPSSGIAIVERVVDSMLVQDRTPGACPACGWTQKQLDETSLAGCPLCYSALDVSGFAS